MRRIHPNVMIGGGLLVFCGVVSLIIPMEIQELMRYDASTGLSPSVFPKLSLFFIALFSALLILWGLRSKEAIAREDGETLKMGSRTRVVTTLIILAAYIYLISILGYLVATPLALGLLMWYFGERRWLLILSVAILATTGISVFFRHVMYIILPEGILFP